MTGLLLRSLLLSLGMTLLWELGFALLCRKRGRALLLTALANILTNPPVVLTALLWRIYGLPRYAVAVGALELLAVGIEGLIYEKSREFTRPYLFSLGANALSYGLGRLIRYLL